MASVELGQGAIVCSEAIITGEVTIGDTMILILFMEIMVTIGVTNIRVIMVIIEMVVMVTIGDTMILILFMEIMMTIGVILG